MKSQALATRSARKELKVSISAIHFDLARPGALLANYKFLLKHCNKYQKRILLARLKHLLGGYIRVTAQLKGYQEIRRERVLTWFKLRNIVLELKRRVEDLKQKLISWVYSTVRHVYRDTMVTIEGAMI